MTVAELRKALESLPDDLEIKVCVDMHADRLEKIWISSKWDDNKKLLRDYLILDAEPADI